MNASSLSLQAQRRLPEFPRALVYGDEFSNETHARSVPFATARQKAAAQVAQRMCRDFGSDTAGRLFVGVAAIDPLEMDPADVGTTWRRAQIDPMRVLAGWALAWLHVLEGCTAELDAALRHIAACAARDLRARVDLPSEEELHEWAAHVVNDPTGWWPDASAAAWVRKAQRRAAWGRVCDTYMQARAVIITAHTD